MGKKVAESGVKWRFCEGSKAPFSGPERNAADRKSKFRKILRRSSRLASSGLGPAHSELSAILHGMLATPTRDASLGEHRRRLTRRASEGPCPPPVTDLLASDDRSECSDQFSDPRLRVGLVWDPRQMAHVSWLGSRRSARKAGSQCVCSDTYNMRPFVGLIKAAFPSVPLEIDRTFCPERSRRILQKLFSAPLRVSCNRASDLLICGILIWDRIWAIGLADDRVLES
jgi:hypothetical protein